MPVALRAFRRLSRKTSLDVLVQRADARAAAAQAQQRCRVEEAALKLQEAAQQRQDAQPAAYPLVGRERECGELDRFFERCAQRSSIAERAIYVSGAPGTGKTCSVWAAVHNFRRQHPTARVLEVNCMELPQQTVAALLARLCDLAGVSRSGIASVHGRSEALAKGLGLLDSPVVLVIDEVDQLVSRSAKAGVPQAAGTLQALFTLAQVVGAPPMAIASIANAVDLLHKATLAPPSGCATLLFEPYPFEDLRRIVKAKLLPEGSDAAKACGLAVDLRLKGVAKKSGDCRQAFSLCEEVVLAAARERAAAVEQAVAEAVAAQAAEAAKAGDEPAVGVETPQPLNQVAPPPPVKIFMKAPSQMDPVRAIAELTLGQQVLLCALVNGKAEAVKVKDAFVQYKDLMTRLRQPVETRAQACHTLEALEQRGLLQLRASKGSRAARLNVLDGTAQLSVPQKSIRAALATAVPVLQQFCSP